jgi:hypothetical protein
MDNPYQSYETRRPKNYKLRKIKEDGIYVFGGIHAKGDPTNKVRVLKLGAKPIKIITLETSG